MKDPVEASPLLESDIALQPFLEAAQDSSSANFTTLLSLESKVLSHPDIFSGYDQLKTILLEPIRKAANSGDDKGEKILQTLDLFSYGTYSDYVAHGELKFMSLSDAQIFKLRQLTVLSLVQTACQNKSNYLSYATVQQALSLTDHTSSKTAATTKTTTTAQNYRAVEQILISCLYAGVVSGRLCQKTLSLRLTTNSSGSSRTTPGRFVSRDVPVENAPQLLATVRHLQSRLTAAQQYLVRAQHQVQGALEQDEQFWNRVSSQRPLVADTWSSALVGHAGLLTAEVTSAAAAMDVTGANNRRQKRSRGPAAAATTSAFQV